MNPKHFNPSAFIRIPAENHPDRICLSYRKASFTYDTINRRSNRLAHALKGLGIEVGMRVATLQYNCNQSFELIVAMWKAGIVMVPLNTRDSAQQNIAILQDSGAGALVFGDEFTDQAREIKRSLPQVTHFIRHGAHEDAKEPWLDYETLLEAAPDHEPNLDMEEDTLCRISYTSGTTGQPRGVLMSYRNRIAQITNVFMNADRLISKDEVFLHVAPLTHAAGYYALPFYLKGARHVILDKFDTTALLQTIERERVTCTLLVPTMIIMLMEDPYVRKADLSSLERIFYGTAPMPLDKLKSALKHFGPIMRQNYGLTESIQPLACLTPEEHVVGEDDAAAQRLRSTGKRALGTEIRIVDEDDRDLKTGEVGEILLRSPHISIGYHNMPEETARTYRGGWLHTGDLGRFDQNGYLYIVDRKKDMIISGGFNIYSREVEMSLDSHPAVLESAVIGLPDEKWGEICTAFVVTREEAQQPDPDDLVEHCVTKGLPKYKAPKKLAFLKSLPKNENNKIIKKSLKKLALDANSDLDVVEIGR